MLRPPPDPLTPEEGQSALLVFSSRLSVAKGQYIDLLYVPVALAEAEAAIVAPAVTRTLYFAPFALRATVLLDERSVDECHSSY